ncbi:MAG: Holliday junction branch migration protein RuvA [Leptospiraceae bacterium]|nr:Holliday junction branch migration protein RuvA [Leptospiraceae bacterium]
MFGLKGKIAKLDVNSVTIDTGAVAYEVQISFKTYSELKEKKIVEAYLHIFHSITDRSEKLFGFLSNKDRELFKTMKSLNGIGELTALKILSFMTFEDLYKAVQNEDKTKLEKIPKVKGKTSEKILFEVKRNLKKFESFLTEGEDFQPTKDDKIEIAVMALVQLGFEEKTARKEVAGTISETGSLDTGEIIKAVLKKL